jgi:hypothetical protein
MDDTSPCSGKGRKRMEDIGLGSYPGYTFCRVHFNKKKSEKDVACTCFSFAYSPRYASESAARVQEKTVAATKWQVSLDLCIC